jgi:hypothetical protein
MVQSRGAGALPAGKSVVSRALILVVHQVLATLGVVLWAGVLAASVLTVPQLWGQVFHTTDLRRVLLASPFYPFQIIVGLLWGWLVWRQFQHRAMLWVWVFPFITLTLGILDDLTRTSNLYPGAIGLDFRITMMRFFGSACRLEDHCFSQIGMTLPFYSGLSYAAGAWLALRFPIRSRLSSRIVDMAVIALGIFILVDTLAGVIREFRLWHSWLVLLAGAFEAAMGACLIVFGVRMRRIDRELMPGILSQ